LFISSTPISELITELTCRRPFNSPQLKAATRLKRPDLDHLAASDEERSPHSQVSSSDSPTAAHFPDHIVSGNATPWHIL